MTTDKQTAKNDQETRRKFWIEYMERSYRLLQSMINYPTEECGEGLGSIPEAANAEGIQMLFSENKIAGDLDRIYVIRSSLIPDLLAIARDMKERGWILKIEDGFRTREMQTQVGRKPSIFDMIVRTCWWENHRQTPPLDLVKRRSMCLVANYPNTGTHMMAAAVDISVFRLDDLSEVSRGGPYLEMSEHTPMDSPFVTPEEQQNRKEITRLMERHGFMHYPGEYWHYNKGDALYHMLTSSGEPGSYGPVDWDPETNQVTPYEDVTSPLTPPELQEEYLVAALDRLNLS